MSMFSDKCLRWIGAILLALAIYFLASAFYIPAKAVIAQSLLQNAWQRTLAGEQNVKPWPWARTWPVARMKVPELGVDQIILGNDKGSSLAFAPGRQVKTFFDKSSGITMISAHRDTHFRFLKNMELGYHIFLQDEAGEVQQYQVEDIQIVDSRNMGIQAPLNGNWLTLVTCFPFDTITSHGPLRYVVFAEAIPSTDPAEAELGVSI